MVAHLLRLKLTLLRNSLKRSTMAVVGLVVGGLYGLGLLVLVLVGLVLLGSAGLEVASTVIILAGSALLLGWLVVPVVAAGIDMTLDPQRLCTFAIPMRTLLAGLALSGVVGIPGAITLLAALGTVGTWWRHPLAAVAAVVCALLAVLTCIVASRAMAAASTSLAASRRFKDASALVLLVPLMLMGPIVAGVGDAVSNFASVLPALARTLSWTPLGAAWAVPAELAGGNYGAAGLKFLIAVGTLAALAWLWKLLLARALVTPAHAGGTRRAAGNLGFFARFPATPTGAVAARSLTYWFRDPRYSAGLVISPLLPLLFAFLGYQNGTLGILLFAGAMATYLLCWFISTDVAYDNTAFALHIATGIAGRGPFRPGAGLRRAGRPVGRALLRGGGGRQQRLGAPARHPRPVICRHRGVPWPGQRVFRPLHLQGGGAGGEPAEVQAGQQLLQCPGPDCRRHRSGRHGAPGGGIEYRGGCGAAGLFGLDCAGRSTGAWNRLPGAWHPVGRSHL
ncbi:transporter [Pseudarthrobacter sp. P1]|uniref:transporter n=1 Tax=Pseudarthrobacter sp. P1 TaxID=3418418 RepID=UPI003CE9FFF7